MRRYQYLYWFTPYCHLCFMIFTPDHENWFLFGGELFIRVLHRPGTCYYCTVVWLPLFLLSILYSCNYYLKYELPNTGFYKQLRNSCLHGSISLLNCFCCAAYNQEIIRDDSISTVNFSMVNFFPVTSSHLIMNL